MMIIIVLKAFFVMIAIAAGLTCARWSLFGTSAVHEILAGIYALIFVVSAGFAALMKQGITEAPAQNTRAIVL